MSKTTAKIVFRDHVPYGVIAIEFCHVNFYGTRARKMEKLLQEIEYQRYIKYHSAFRDNKIKIATLKQKASSMIKEVNKSKPFYRFWNNKAEKRIISEANQLLKQANDLEKKSAEIGSKRFFTAFERHQKIQDILQQNGFVLTAVESPVVNDCITTTEIWTLEE